MKPIDRVWEYHQKTKHSTSGYAPGPGYLDWDSQPHPFRRYKGAPLVSLPLQQPPETLYSKLYTNETPAVSVNREHISVFFELAMGLSAWKSIGGESWALRNNPSSGNLHPTEAYLVLWKNIDDELIPGVYHYAPYEHGLERRATMDDELAQQLVREIPGVFAAIGFSSVHWREEWKYGSRALRYCQHDVGHGLAAARYSAATLGWTVRVDSSATDDEIRRTLGVHHVHGDAEPEHPDLLAFLGTRILNQPVTGDIWKRITSAVSPWEGRANRLSATHCHWPQISQVLPALEKGGNCDPGVEPGGEPNDESNMSPVVQKKIDADYVADRLMISAEKVIRQRRSAGAMTPGKALARANFFQMLARVLPSADTLPFDSFPFAPAIQLLLFVHDVEGLEPGLYAVDRLPNGIKEFSTACKNKDLQWRRVDDCPLPLYSLLTPMIVRSLAAQISCTQQIAGDSAFSLGMIADLQGTIQREGPWAYRRLFWEAGIIGQVLYLEAVASGMSGTGIGCFFDDAVHHLLGLSPNGPWQSLYHFTIGTPQRDTRLTTLPGYYHLDHP